MRIYHGSLTGPEDLVMFDGDTYSQDPKGPDLEGCSIIYAEYENEYYEGSAFVIFEKDGKVFEVNGSHCSCYGLEGQWEPEETTVEALLARPNVPEQAKDNLRLFFQVH